MTTTRVLIADDHPIVLAGLAGLIRPDPGFTVVAEARDGQTALEEIERLQPDIAVLDLVMPRLSGLDVLKATRRSHPSTRCLLLAAMASPSAIYEAVAEQAAAILLKDMTPNLLLDCLNAIRQGASWPLSETLRRDFEREGVRRDKWQRLSGNLTARESELVQLVLQGLSTKAIASATGIAEGTLKIHLNSIFRKLEVASRSEVMELARDQR